ncbi:MAG: type II toxin-antitoxin system RelE/ParE family toxin [Crocosphaera sp.]|nr:type II toxin-antitoxin system RelE/ParE family toxin [Crocosphaera sp.]
MSKYSLSQEAIHDLDEISSYFAKVSIEAGERFVKRFADKCRNLINFPSMGGSYSEIIPGLRGAPLDSYIILYQVKGEEIEVVRVVSGYRDLDYLFSNDEES